MSSAELPEIDVSAYEPLARLNADLRRSARLLGRDQVRSLVDLYYQVQEVRKGTANQERAAEEGEPNILVGWLAKNWRSFENDVKRSMHDFAESYRVGQWMMSIVGIGPVISAGFLAHLHPLPNTVGHWWRYAGYDPSVKWQGRDKNDAVVKAALSGASPEAAVLTLAREYGRDPESLFRMATTNRDGSKRNPTADNIAAALSRRPWNGKLKTLCFKTGDCFVKFCNHPKQFYGTVYLERKAYEQPKNERGDYREQAERALSEKRYGRDTEARKWYEQGKLPPARIHMRCLRYAVKMFLSHLHEVMWSDLRPDEPLPKPYGLTHLSGDHRHYLPPPNVDLDDPWTAYNGRSLRELGE